MIENIPETIESKMKKRGEKREQKKWEGITARYATFSFMARALRRAIATRSHRCS